MLDVLERRVREVVGDRGTVERSEIGYDWDVLEVTPSRPDARAITISSEDRLLVMLGRDTGHFSVTYDDDGIAMATALMEATIAGHIIEHPSWLGMRVTVRLADGRRRSTYAFAVPPVLFGKRRNVPIRRYVAY
ncbi:hypothetical protein SAMN04489720_3207 [Agrococcus jejuensis]|uniref:Uncharacterized protein n=1 Tax=Agrococcus jejuensis TaxID=399736 RepID=A0A1G8H4A5_9MICO|nr:hypothetical protein SAMN04489720_3207 [Agrococcus jejuensis]